jgi:hypothetical protein
VKSWVLLAVSFLAVSTNAEFIVESPLDFGDIAVRSNTSVSTVRLERSGAQTSTNDIIIVKPGSPAVFTLANMPGYTTINLTADIPAVSRVAYPNAAQFSITAIDLPSSINTGPTGTVQFKMGGTLSTSGDPSKHYYDGAQYEIYINLNLDY